MAKRRSAKVNFVCPQQEKKYVTIYNPLNARKDAVREIEEQELRDLFLECGLKPPKNFDQKVNVCKVLVGYMKHITVSQANELTKCFSKKIKIKLSDILSYF